MALLVLFFAMLLMLYFMINDTYWVNENGEEVHGISVIGMAREEKHKWAGMLTGEQIAKVIEENNRINATSENQSDNIQKQNIAYSWKQGFKDIRYLMNYSYGEFQEWSYDTADYLTPERAADFYPNRIRNLQEWLKEGGDGASAFTEKEKNFLMEQYKNLNTPLYYDYHDGWENMLQWAAGMIMITTIVLGFLCAGIFADEFRLKASAVFYSSYHGRRKAVTAKIKAGFLIVTAVYWISVLIYSAIILGIFGAEGINCPIQVTRAGWKSFYNITIGQEYLMILLGGYLGCLFMSALVMLVSAGVRSSLLAVTVPFALIFLPSFLSELKTPALNKILGLMPDQLLQIKMVLTYFNLYEIGGKVFGSIPLLMIIYLPFMLALIPAIYWSYKRHQVMG